MALLSRRKLEGVPVDQVPIDASIGKFELDVEGFVLKFEYKSYGPKWDWVIFTQTDGIHVMFSGEEKTVGNAMAQAISAVVKARAIDAEPR